jgi:hypothetical protein
VYYDDANEAAPEQRKHNMNTSHNLKRIIAGALLSGGLVSAGLGLAAGTAQAQPGFAPLYQWCPGQHWQWLIPPPPDWDMSVCHNVKVVYDTRPPRIVEDPNPPPPPPNMFAQCPGLIPFVNCLPGL